MKRTLDAIGEHFDENSEHFDENDVIKSRLAESEESEEGEEGKKNETSEVSSEVSESQIMNELDQLLPFSEALQKDELIDLLSRSFSIDNIDRYGKCLIVISNYESEIYDKEYQGQWSNLILVFNNIVFWWRRLCGHFYDAIIHNRRLDFQEFVLCGQYCSEAEDFLSHIPSVEIVGDPEFCDRVLSLIIDLSERAKEILDDRSKSINASIGWNLSCKRSKTSEDNVLTNIPKDVVNLITQKILSGVPRYLCSPINVLDDLRENDGCCQSCMNLKCLECEEYFYFQEVERRTVGDASFFICLNCDAKF
jgi:hypothetical protein